MMVDRLDESAGGGERFMAGLATHLSPERFEVWACTTRPSRGGLLEALDEAGVRHVDLGRRSRLDVHRFRRLGGLLRAKRFDVLHAHKFGSNVWGTLFGRAFGVPVVIAHEQTWSYQGEPLRRFLDRQLIGRLATRFVAVSAADRDRMIRIEKVPPHKIVLIPNAFIPRAGTDAGSLRQELGLASDAPLVGTICHLRAQKAIEVLLDAHALVLQRHPRAHLVIAGDGECRAALEAQAAALRLNGAVRFLGVRQDAERIMRSLDVAAMSSDFEGTPLFMFECMNHRVPLVATDVGGIPDVVEDGVSARLVPPRNAEALANAISELIENPGFGAAIAAAARSDLGPYRIEAIAERFEALYETLLEERARE